MSLSPSYPIPFAQADFAFDLLHEVSMHNQSMVLSPISVAMALSMVLLGAENETGHEMDQLLANNANALGHGFPGGVIGGYFRNQLNALANQSEANANYTLEMANRVFVKSGFHVERKFASSLKYFYGSGLEQVDFNDKQAAADHINEFVSNATHEKIQLLVRPDMFNPLSRLVLVNAVYFKGLWANPFNPNNTVMRSFHVDEEHLEMMVTTGEFRYWEDDHSQLLAIPYSGNDIHLFVMLPKSRFGLAEIPLKFPINILNIIPLDMRPLETEVKVVLPKFKLESTHDLKEPLKNMGMPSAFSDDAHFGLISKEERLKIDFVVQKAMIELNEEGTEAAASTAAGAGQLKSAPAPPVNFVADHPFAFFLVANYGPLQNDVLFAGMFYG